MQIYLADICRLIVGGWGSQGHSCSQQFYTWNENPSSSRKPWIGVSILRPLQAGRFLLLWNYFLHVHIIQHRESTFWRAGGAAQWQPTCLPHTRACTHVCACVKPWVGAHWHKKWWTGPGRSGPMHWGWFVLLCKESWSKREVTLKTPICSFKRDVLCFICF